MHVIPILSPGAILELVKESNSGNIVKRKTGKGSKIRIRAKSGDHSIDAVLTDASHEDKDTKVLGLTLRWMTELRVKRRQIIHACVNVESGHCFDEGAELPVEKEMIFVVGQTHPVVVKEGFERALKNKIDQNSR